MVLSLWILTLSHHADFWQLIADNLVERLPGNLGKLQSLKVLMLDGNRISCLPDECKMLFDTSTLFVNFKTTCVLLRFVFIYFSCFPVGQLVRLEQLSISRNMLIYLPDTIGSLRNVSDFIYQSIALGSP